ncbi:MAG: Rne/Rng family ribonuclease [Acidimicrobiia bacterium]|nr:Rne/Rng family ribonuclease [Acidimicrobiia bacterium]
MPDEIVPEAATSPATDRQPVPPPTPPPTREQPASAADGVVAERTGPPRRRRRGSRGGRGRKRPATEGLRGGGGGEDWHDADADRGLTADDVAAEAREDAGLSPATAATADRPRIGDTRPAPKPKIGDTRPAPPATRETGGNGAGKGGDGARAPGGGARRRRRGSRGRGRGGGAGGAGGGERARAETTAFVEADLGTAEAPTPASRPELDADVLRRRRGRTRKGRPAGRYLMCVHVQPGQAMQIAVLEGRNLVEHYVSWPEDDDTSIDGNVYLGRVQNVLPGMEAAFVDIGTPKNGVLYRGDVAFDPSDVEESQPRIERLLKNGQSILVQVTKNPIGHKGARLTQEVSLAGRFVVMIPGQPQTYGISKRLPDDERKRLRRILEDLRPADAGLIVRTAAEGATADELERDLRRLTSQWEQVSALARQSKPGRLVYKEPNLVLRVVREEFTKEYRGIVIDDRALYEEVRAYVEAMAPELADRIEYYDESEEHLPVFERHHVHEQLHKALDRKVWLPSGGSLVIERTEALTVIDVNTGKNVGKSNLEETVYQNNLEAAEEIARQLRLRDIGGIIVIDFIDMEVQQNRDDVLRVFRQALARDKTRTQVFEISELGLVEMTRKRISEGLVESFSQTCPTCEGRGFQVDESLLR